MTTCLRSLKLNLHPKLSLIKGRQSTSHAGLPIMQSNFLYEFLDCPSERNLAASIDLKALMPIGVVTAAWSLNNANTCHTFDPALHMVVMKPLAVTSDDILFHNNLNPYWCNQHILDDDLKRDVIQRENYSVTVVTERLPSTITGAIEKWPPRTPLTELELNAVVSAIAKDGVKSAKPSNDPTGKPSDEQLERIYLKLSNILPKFFTQTHDYSLYHPQLVFYNNIRGVTTHGVGPYIRQLSFLRLIGHFKFAYVKMDILKVTKHQEDGTIRVRWRIRGVSGLKVFLQFWKFRLWDYKTVKEKEVVWYDGFSTFYVGNDGLIHKHVCDKMMPDEHKEKSTTANLAAKLALVIGFLPRPSLDTLGGFSIALMRFHDEEFYYPINIK